MNTTNLNNQNSKTDQTFTQACTATCRNIIGQINRVRQEVGAEFSQIFGAHERLLQQVINEADALAHETTYPHLIFPLLAVEKAQTAARWQTRQQRLRHQIPTHTLAA